MKTNLIHQKGINQVNLLYNIFIRLKIIKGIAAGMEHLHKEKIVHRDLSARNILLNERDKILEAVVADFGLLLK